MAGSFSIDLSAVVRCRSCGRMFDLSGLREVSSVDATFSVVGEMDGPCPGCEPDDDGGDGNEVGAAAE